MPLNRRSVLRIAGSSAVILAAGAGAFATTRRPDVALGPWSVAGASYADPRLKALSYAILAPNPHNRQPWLVRLDGQDAVTLYCDAERLLPETDPYGRQIVIGLGCFLELMRMAAAEDGQQADIEPFPEGEPSRLDDGRAVARIRFVQTPDVARDPLFGFVPHRRSNKEPFDSDRPVQPETLTALSQAAVRRSAVRTFHDTADIAELRQLTWQAHLLEMRTPRTLMESVRLMRIGKAEINANPDGIDLGGPMMESLRLLGLLDREQLADPGSTAFSQGLEHYRAIMGSGMAYVCLLSDDNSRVTQLEAGRDWLRLNLRATELGLSAHPVSQALQEFPEMADLHARMRIRLGARPQQTVQMLGRLGYGPSVPPSPRWPLESRIRTTT